MAVSYAKARGLEACASSPSLLLLDPDLSDALFKASCIPSMAALNPRMVLHMLLYCRST